MLLVGLIIACALAACSTVPPTPTAEIPVAVPIDCHAPTAGPRPDLSALASLTKDSTPQLTIEVMGAALAALAEDDARLRALMAHGN